ncbi:MAG TPA: hypothetical protein VKF63_14610 [Terracidiphilus sp.]|nr:hypothetical protein [Terracidiphilus sp.]
MSFRKLDFLSISRITLAILLLLSALPLIAQYPGQVTKTSHDAPVLRSIAVLEWTGEPGHPKTSRLVPVAVFDGSRIEGDQLQDGGIYMARPQPLALSGEVEYELQQNGHPLGLFDIKNAGQEQGSWVGYGSWKPLPAPKPKPSMAEVARSLRETDDEYSDRPVLHRKHPASEAPSGTGSTGSTSPSATSAPSAPAPASDSDRPTLHKRDSSETSTSTAPAPDSDRPTLKKGRTRPPEDIGHVDSLPDVTDSNRPRLKRGKSSNNIEVLPTLMGLPPDMQQAVAISDAKTRPEHPWTFIWANPDDEAKMKSALEAMALDALGLTPPPPPPAPRKPTSRKAAQPAHAPPPPAPLLDENFRVFELAYGSGATLVLTARTDGPLIQQKFVTLIAQPDFYGNLLVLLKYVAGGAHLDDTPRMRLIDAVDALADNRGELLFELRGTTQRQFALYRVLRGQAEKLFITGPGEFGQEIR